MKRLIMGLRPHLKEMVDPTKRDIIKRLSKGEVFYFSTWKCKCTNVGSTEYSWVQLDGPRDGLLPFTTFERDFKWSDHGYFCGTHPSILKVGDKILDLSLADE